MSPPLSLPLAFGFGNFAGFDGLIILIIGLLIFGRRLPEVGKNVGRTIVEFKKGLSGAYNASGEEKEPEQPESPAQPQRRLSGAAPRVSVNQNLEEQPRRTTPRKSLPQTEEV